MKKTYKERALELAQRGHEWVWQRICLERNEARTFMVSIKESDATGEVSVIRQWGRIGSPLQTQIVFTGDKVKAIEAASEHLMRRLEHKYQLVSIDGMPYME